MSNINNDQTGNEIQATQYSNESYHLYKDRLVLPTIMYIYPKSKVIWTYVLLGGAIGGLIVWSYMTTGILFESGISIQELPDFIKMLIGSAVFGFFLGLLPALLTGYVASKFEMFFDSTKKILPLFAIGFMSTFIYIVWFMLDKNSIDSLIGIIMFCCVGGTSAVITGWFALPKYT